MELMPLLERFARGLLAEPRTAVLAETAAFHAPPPMAIWIGYLYGYSFSGIDAVGRPESPFVMHFQRDDDPEARRRAAWMGDPAADPGLPPPVAWRMGGYGFHPPRWHPDVRLVVPPEQEVAMAAMAEQLLRQAGMALRPGGGAVPRRSVPPPPPPPGDIAFPDRT